METQIQFFSHSPFSNFQSPKKPKNKIKSKWPRPAQPGRATQASVTWVDELRPRVALGEVVADRDKRCRRDRPPRQSRMRPRPSCTSPRSLGTESGTWRTGPGLELAMALRESKAYWYLKFERNLGFVYVILGCWELLVFGSAVVFFVFFLDVNWVLETRFPGRCHVENVPHQTWTTHENRVPKTRFIDPKSSLLDSIC